MMAAEQKSTPCDWIGVLWEHSKACSKVGYVCVTKYKTSSLLLGTTRFCDQQEYKYVAQTTA